LKPPLATRDPFDQLRVALRDSKGDQRLVLL
jgi:hypothetical protein